MTGSSLCFFLTITASVIITRGFSANQEYGVKGKIALVTGGAQGIGFGCVSELLMNGARGVTIVDNNKENGKQAARNLNQQHGYGRVIFIPADVSNQKNFENAFQISINHWKGIDIVINNAGVFNEYNWKLMIDANLMGVLYGTLLGFKYMSQGKGGSGGVIINIASIAGIDAIPFFPVYSGTKHFVVGLGRSLGHSSYYEYNKIRIITICPGFTDTTLARTAPNFVTNDLIPFAKELTTKSVENITFQEVSHLTKSILYTITQGNSGSVWVIEDNKPPYEINFPDRNSRIKQNFET